MLSIGKFCLFAEDNLRSYRTDFKCNGTKIMMYTANQTLFLSYIDTSNRKRSKKKKCF